MCLWLKFCNTLEYFYQFCKETSEKYYLQCYSGDIKDHLRKLWIYYSVLYVTKQLCEQSCPCINLSIHFFVCHSQVFHNVSLIVSSWNSQDSLPLMKQICMQKTKISSLGSRSQLWKQICPKFAPVTPVWICKWLWNDAQSLKWCKQNVLLFFIIIIIIIITFFTIIISSSSDSSSSSSIINIPAMDTGMTSA